MPIWEKILTGIFEPLLDMSPIAAIAIVSFAIALLINFVYKIMTDQKLMKELKGEIKHLQQEMKKFREHPAKMMEIQKKAMEKNMKYMINSMKPTLITLLPLIVIFGWLNANLAYDPIAPGEEFTVTINFDENAVGDASVAILGEGLSLMDDGTKPIDGSATWTFKGDLGEHLIQWRIAGKQYDTAVLISNQQKYNPVLEKENDNTVKTIQINNKKKVVMNLFGFWGLGWLGAYIIFSIIFSMITRKVMGLH
ncbi:EMC3/TMCO1 family protein [Nanoarchaeota archaeon]